MLEKGYDPELVDMGLKWARKWTINAVKYYVKHPELRYKISQDVYKNALKLCEKWIKEMTV